MQTLPSLLTAAFSRRPERIALRDDTVSLAYGELNRRSNALANSFLEFGLEPEARVATLLPNRLEAPIVDVAIYKTGAARLPINPELSETAIEHILTDAEPAVVVCDASRLDDVADLVDDLSTRPVCVAVESADPPDGWRSAARLENGAAADSPAVSVEPDAIAGHFYTGGTTGDPKGVCYTQSCLTTNLLAHPADLGFSSDDTGLVATPISHSAGTFLLAALLTGGTVVLHRGFNEDDFCAAVETHRVTWTFLVPTMLYRLLDGPLAAWDVSSLENVIYGAAPIRPDRLREALDRLGPILTQFYGQTEVPNLITTLDRRDHARVLEDGDEHLLGSAGQPCLLSDVKIVDPETDEERETDEPGELLARAPYAFDGYFGLPEATDETLVDGWVRTGDIGRIDDEGYLYLLDRRSDVVVTGGMNVYTGEVERALGEQGDVGDVAVVGVPHEDWGEAVHAVVVPAEGLELDVHDLLAFAGQRLAGYKRPKSVAVVEALPTTPFGKIDREALRERYWADEDRRIN
ncbi:AMP-binding protein [Natrialbaceae archaeon GCM10025810]|uniref:AMP-binding protein n=1 Tax=Halovalidus salilacus TaxID=3075124 RepID=UPI00361C4EA8